MSETIGDFGWAIQSMKRGERVCRRGWNGKGMFLILVNGSNEIKPYHGSPYAQVVKTTDKETISILPHIDMFTVQGDMLCGWLASQTDMLAEDWEVAL